MHRLSLAMTAAAAALAVGAGSATAQEWTSINQRQAMLEQRIEAGIRSGQLTPREAEQLRHEFRALETREARYRVNGLSMRERADLDAQFDKLQARIRYERTDNERRGWFGGRDWYDDRGQWVAIDRRKDQLDRRIEQGLRSGQLTRSEAARLRAEFNEIARVEARYKRGGLSMGERADLDRRFDRLAAQIRYERRDDDRRYGWNR